MFAFSGQHPRSTISRVAEEVEIPPNLMPFGPMYMDGSEQEDTKKAKDSAWNHILKNSSEDDGRAYEFSIRSIEKQAIDSYDIPALRPELNMVFREMMVKDGCLFLQMALHMLGGGDLLHYNENHSYFGKQADSTIWIPDMFFMGNQIPYCVIRALMKQRFFHNVIQTGTWRRPVKDLCLLILHVMVVEPELELIKSQSYFSETPNDILHGLHSLISGSAGRDYHPFHSELRELPDLEASNRVDIEFPSAVELKDLGIKLRPAKEPGITKILFRDFGYSAKLYLPTLVIDSYTKHILTNLVRFEGTLHESHREVMAYLRFMMNLVRTREDFKILEENSVVTIVNYKRDMEFMPDDLPTIIYKSKFTANTLKIRRQITEYGRQPRFLIRIVIKTFAVISAIVSISSIVGSIFTILAYFHPPK